ncbi:YafY family protein [Glycomyces sp. NRRL B-16210]|uniref:helix-turn-helix transcriptional regulator n=1 Tax=Glycomyces sp. NRRL B-16210 TaxID=1463821 RepID=UPI0004BF8267|nr:WYL domain-containing protein [Glycomyces sp. NRRL B-16210]
MSETSSRLLKLLSVLQTPRDWPGPQLAERMGVDVRTVRRDVDRLREMGYRIRALKGPHGGYRLDAGSALPPLLFDDDQAVALAAALQSVTAPGIEEAAARALATVRQVLPSRLRHRVDALQVTAVNGPDAPAVRPELLAAVGAAVRSREELRFDYSGKEGVQRRRAQPHHLVTRLGRWYLVAWDPERGDWRIFRVDRMELRTPYGPRFTPRDLPGGDVRAFVSARFKGSDSVNAWPCRGEAVLAAPAADIAPYAGDGLVEDLGSGRCRIALGSWSWPALAAAIGRFDADVEEARPPQLAAAFTRLAARFARAGRDSPQADA